MSFVPSVRECLHRLDRLRDTPSITAALHTIAYAEQWGHEGRVPELNAAVERLTELHQLCMHLATNMSGGAGVPPTPQVKATVAPKTPAASVVVPPKPKVPVTHWQRTPPVTPPQPANRQTIGQLTASLRRSAGWVYKRMVDEGFPRPVGSSGKCKLWDTAAVQAWVAARPLPLDPGKRKPKVFSNATTYTTAEAAQALGIAASTLLTLRSRGMYGLDAVAGAQGKSLLFPRALVDRVVAERAANPPAQGRPRSTAPEASPTASSP